MPNHYLREADETVMGHLQDIFGFEPHRHGVYDATYPGDRDQIDEFGRGIGIPFDHKTLKSDVISLIHGEDDQDPSYAVIFLNAGVDTYPTHLSNELTFCEHAMNHGVVEDAPGYESKFCMAYRAMIGTLGVIGVSERMRPAIQHFFPSEPGEGSVLSVPNYIGFYLGAQLARSGQDIPYRDLFHASDQKQGMRIFTDIEKPRIVCAVERGKTVRAEIAGAFVAMGLDTSICQIPLS